MACTPTTVRQIFTTKLDDTALTAFIAAANVIIGTDGCDLAAKGLTAATIDEICRWLAAHMATTDDPRVAEHRSSGHSVKFESEIGLGLDSSRYGQMVKRLDKTGCINAIDKADRVKFLAKASRASPTSTFTERQI